MGSHAALIARLADPELIAAVARAVCECEGDPCRNCDGMTQHFNGVRNGVTVNYDRPCPYLNDANAAIGAILKAMETGDG